MKPNLIVILIDDLRFDETSASGHPYMKTPNIDRLAHEGAQFLNAFHTTPLCSPNRASILTGQYASRPGPAPPPPPLRPPGPSTRAATASSTTSGATQ